MTTTNQVIVPPPSDSNVGAAAVAAPPSPVAVAFPFPPVVNKTKGEKILARHKNLIGKLWPEVSDELIWNRKRNDGFITIPRTLPLIQQIMDELEVGKPMSSTYLSLWCRSSDAGLVTVENPKELALESGFKNLRAESAWNSRMKLLVQHGFIKTSKGFSGSYHNVLILNPHLVINEMKNKGVNIREDLFNTLFARAQRIGASDMV